MKLPRHIAAVATAGALLLTSMLSGSALAATESPGAGASAQPSRQTMLTYARDTWHSFEAMLYPRTGLPADNIEGSLAAASRSRYTSPTNIGAYLWSTIVARELGFVDAAEARARMAKTLDTLATLDRHDPSGMYYNWYDPKTGEVLRTWPGDGHTVYPFLSSVDNGWLAAALIVVRNAEPALSGEATAILDDMDFGFYYNPDARGKDFPAGLIRGGFWDEEPPGCSVKDNYRDRGPDVYYTCHHYGTLNSEPRIASYLGIAWGQIPPEHYFAMWRTMPPTCDWAWQEQKPVGYWTEHMGVPVYEGAYRYRGMRVVPSWGGDMFEALMPALFVPEAKWGPRSWGINHPLTVEAQIEHGLEEADYGYWGFSPASDPAGGYRAYGVDAIGMLADGYVSDMKGTLVDDGFEGCRPDETPKKPQWGDGVVTPHAVFLALPYKRHAALANLAKMRENLDVYGPGGFYDSVAVGSGRVVKRYLALDQGMIMASLGNVLAGDVIHRAFTENSIEKAIRPLLARERFKAHP